MTGVWDRADSEQVGSEPAQLQYEDPIFGGGSSFPTEQLQKEHLCHAVDQPSGLRWKLALDSYTDVWSQLLHLLWTHAVFRLWAHKATQGF